jgi:ubiquitin-activating enzyme E1
MLTFSSALPDDPEQETINNNLIEFVRSAARLRLETLLAGTAKPGDTSFTVEDAVVILGGTGDADIRQSRGGDSNSNQPVAAIVQTLLDSSNTHSSYNAVEFEKDDESNGHVNFVTAASNLRAIAYGIPPVDSMETRRVAGNIIPAVVTTTAFVSGLSCIELIKLVQNAPLTVHRSAFVNLALPFFAFTMPLPAEQIEGLHGRHYTLWNRLLVKEGKKAATSGGLTMRSLIRRIKKQASDEPELVDVASVNFGPYMLFANFLHDGDESVLDSSVWELISDAIASSEAFDDEFSRTATENNIGNNAPDNRGSVELTVVVEDLKTGEEFELPPVRVNRYKSREQEADI